MAPDYAERVRAVGWSTYQSAYGSADKVGQCLIDLTSPEREVALKASGTLWAGLCHQTAYLSSAAAPALPFLLEVARVADTPLLIELMDVFNGFAACSRPPAETEPKGAEWAVELRAYMLAEFSWFKAACDHSDEDVREFAEMIVGWLTTPRGEPL